ncbi:MULTISPECIES: hypothetical protein [Streptomyces]|uniref:Uncharacterized protein n=1 Tax=Streptomyces antimycoticus TaxID=68175 RepID=A0ABD5JKB7_9ACTN|nr:MULTISPECIES: hypothetical protein [Streptomyces]MEE4588182.1 hypothetical protein [Streptomyces sp. DSM 41602]WJD94705.1 hypothetical protein QR300_00945 [Streptomyces antimycoticus]
MTDGVRRGGPHLILGLLQHPKPAAGLDHLYARLPPPARWARRMLMNKFRKTLKDLAAD